MVNNNNIIISNFVDFELHNMSLKKIEHIIMYY